MRIVAFVCTLILVASACGSVSTPADATAATPCVLGSSQLGHCTLAH